MIRSQRQTKLLIFKLNFTQAILYAVLGRETLYYRREPGSENAASESEGSPFEPLSLKKILKPFYLLADYHIFMATIAYAITFNFTLVLAQVEFPAVFTPLFHLNPQQIGLNFLSLLVGYEFFPLLRNNCKSN